jgi:hypothetical protein
MDEIISILISVIKNIPQAVNDVELAMQKAGFTNAEIEAIFADVIDYDKLGINPNHPVADEPARNLDPLTQPHIAARSAADIAAIKAAQQENEPLPDAPTEQQGPDETEQPLKPALTSLPLPPKMTGPKPPPFERAR